LGQTPSYITEYLLANRYVWSKNKLLSI
jgi:hypothetical protein